MRMELRAGAERWRGVREAAMKPSIDQDCRTLETLAAAIARSPIVVAQPAPRLPAGFTEVDAAILDWIAAEGRRIGRAHRPM